MNLSLRNKLFISFLTVIIITGSFSTIVGIKLIGESITIIQNKVRLDLNSAREIYRETVEDIRNAIRFTSIRFFIKDAFLIGDIDRLTVNLEEIRKNESLDFLTLTDPEGKVLTRARNPEERGDSKAYYKLIDRVLKEKTIVVSTEIFFREELLKEGKELPAQAYTEIIPTPGNASTGKAAETSGMVIIAAAPILNYEDEILGILYGGRLLNRDNSIVDKIKNTVYGDEKYSGKDVGAVSIFQGNLRIASNTMTKEGNRAIGTLVSDDVYQSVFVEGNTWIEKAFAVDDWYITAYEPIKNISGETVGLLGLGVLENKYRDMQKNVLWIFLGITFGGIVLSIVICGFLTKTIMRPINSLLLATQNLSNGNLEQQVRLKDAPKEIDVLGKAFNFMVSSIKERDKQLRQRAQEEIIRHERLAMVGQLAAGVAHEINNPMGGILMFSHLLLRKAPPEGIMRENLERIEKDAKRCKDIVQGLLDFAREREPKIETFQINEVLKQAINLFENQPLFDNIEVVKQYQSDLPVISADPAQIQQVFVNIIKNAADAMNGKGMLMLNTRSSETSNDVEISFTDTGSGMSPDQLSHVFEPFFTTKEVGHGTGLGLSISYGIIQRHGGTIKVFSKVGEGSTFIVKLPKPNGKS